MPLRLRVGQYSDKGRKPANQDCLGLCLADEPQQRLKGATVVLADGISSSEAGAQAAQAAVRSLLDDYYCTPDTWSVKTSVERVLVAANSWLYAQTQAGHGRYDKDRGWVCTLSAMVFKSRTAHLFHVGDSRIYQLHAKALELLTRDHRVQVGDGQSLLARALGAQDTLEIDHHTLALAEGDTFVLMTDGVHEHLGEGLMHRLLAEQADDLEAGAKALALEALQRGSPDNLSVQVVRVEALPEPQAQEAARTGVDLPLPPALQPRDELDGLRIVRALHASSRSQVWLAVDTTTARPVAVKVPAVDLRDDPAALERFALEEWVARRIDSPHVLRAHAAQGPRSALYGALEYVEGSTLAQWMQDHPRAELATVRNLVEQIARGLRAFHRLEMLHQDLRPQNLLVDANGTVKIIDFGSVRVAGLAEQRPDEAPADGTAQYLAPECLLGHPGTVGSDLFSLAVIAYELLTGRLPYGTEVARCRTLAEQSRLVYRTAQALRPLPDWVDSALQKALQPDPRKRYADVDEFVHALAHPDPAFHTQRPLSLIERHPLRFWQALSALLALACLLLAGLWTGR